tara:strand:- start:218 stop:409 length:192 start_codon:yes stop_codon:yes gene_type:complete
MKVIVLLALISFSLSGCILTKVVSTPLRLTGSVVSAVPIVGDGVESVIDSTADAIDIIGVVLD